MTFRKLFSGLGVLLALNLLLKPLWLLVENRAQDAVGNEAYGLYAALASLSFMLAPLLDPGLNQYAVNVLAADRQPYRELIGRIAALKAVLGLVYFTALLGVGWFIGYRGDALLLLALIGFMQLALSALTLTRAVFQAFQSFITDALASSLDKALLMVVIVLALLAQTFTLNYFVVALLVCTFISAAFFVGRAVLKHGMPLFQFEKRKAYQLLRLSFPFALLVLLFNVNDRLNQVLLERLNSPAENGIYAAAYRWFGALSMYIWTVLPVFYARFSAQRNEAVETRNNWFNLAQTLVAIPILFAAGFIYFHGEKLFFEFKHSAPAEIAAMTLNLKILATVLALNGVFNVYSTYLTATGKEGYVNYWMAAAIVVGAAIYLWRIPIDGALGASVGLLAAFAVTSFGFVYSFARHTDMAVPVVTLIKLIVLWAISLALWALCVRFGIHWLAAVAINLAFWGGAGYFALLKEALRR